MRLDEELEVIERIGPLDEAAMQAARARQATLTKPAGSLGRLENLATQIAGITGKARPSMARKALFVMAGDHGVVAEGVSAYPQQVTPQMVANILNGGAAINALAQHVGASVRVVDVGVAFPLPTHPALISRRIANGTANIARGPAMTRQQAVAAIRVGVEVFEAQLAQGLDLVGTGDMGIGNTTPSSAIATVLTGEMPACLVGKGTGVDQSGLARKCLVVERALSVNQPNPHDGLDVLAKVGGYEIGAIAGLILGAAANRCPVLIDGFISTAGAMIAVTLAPQVQPYLIAAHLSDERGHRAMLNWLGLDPLLDLNMRLGEGTGAALAMSLADAACKLLSEMATFAEAGVAGKEA